MRRPLAWDVAAHYSTVRHSASVMPSATICNVSTAVMISKLYAIPAQDFAENVLVIVMMAAIVM